MIIGLMAIFAGMGTLNFGDYQGTARIFDCGCRLSQSPAFSAKYGPRNMATSRGYPREWLGSVPHLNARPKSCPASCDLTRAENRSLSYPVAHMIGRIQADIDDLAQQGYGYWLLVVAGLGIFCGCVGKSAQFPLHVWLPDAMEGPTPVSALIHAATMVAAGVYLVGRCYPIFTPEVLLVIAIVGTITLFIAATIAITATDIKRVLAYSTVSQLGYMMLALGLGGWLAGMFHLFTHAFFKALLVPLLRVGDPRHGHQRNAGDGRPAEEDALDRRHDARRLPGDRRGGHPAGRRAERLLLQGRASWPRPCRSSWSNPLYGCFFWIAAGGAAITAFYMFRLWYMTFAGKPRDEHVYHHAHESPWVMVGPLVVLAFFAVVAGWTTATYLGNFGLPPLLEQARPLGTEHGASAGWSAPMVSHASGGGVAREHPEIEAPPRCGPSAPHWPGSCWRRCFTVCGNSTPTTCGSSSPRSTGSSYTSGGSTNSTPCSSSVPRCKSPSGSLPATSWASTVRSTAWRGWPASWPGWTGGSIAIFVDGLVDGLAGATYAVGLRLRGVQSGNLRQYVLWIAVGTVALFLLISFYWNWACPEHSRLSLRESSTTFAERKTTVQNCRFADTTENVT